MHVSGQQVSPLPDRHRQPWLFFPGRRADGRTGWRTSGNSIYGQNTPGIPGGSEEGDSFGSSVALLDHNRDGRLDLTVGASGENRGAGAITTLRGSAAGFTTNGSRTFGLATLDYRYPSGAGFGESLGS